MAENRKLTQKDIDVIGIKAETVKGVAETGETYDKVHGFITEFSYRLDDDRREHNRSGDGPMQSDQSIGQRKVSGKLSYKVCDDFKSGDSASESMLYLALGKDSMLSTTNGRIFPRGTKYINYESQSESFAVGEILTGGTSGATAIIKYDIDGGSTGSLVLDKVAGDFSAGETITDSQGTPGSATSSEANTEVGPELDSFTIWCRQKNFDDGSTYNHVVTGCHIQKLTVRGMDNGDVEFDIEYKAMRILHTAPVYSSLPSEPYIKGRTFFKWTSADASTFTISRAGTEQRVKNWEVTIDNGDLHFVPKAGQAYACDYVPGMLTITGTMDFYVNDTELYTLWDTDPNTDKTITHDAGTTFVAGETLTGLTYGASGYIVRSSAGTTTLRRVQGQFASGETLQDETGNSTAATSALADTGTIDFELILTKNSDAEYLRFDFYNIVPTGSTDFSHNPNEDALWMIRYPFKVLRPHNFVCKVLS